MHVPLICVGMLLQVEKFTTLTIGFDKIRVGDFAAKVREHEPYYGKGRRVRLRLRVSTRMRERPGVR